jgi:hypothetical protein
MEANRHRIVVLAEFLFISRSKYYAIIEKNKYFIERELKWLEETIYAERIKC